MATRTAYTPKKQSTGISQPKRSSKMASSQLTKSKPRKLKLVTPDADESSVELDKDSSVSIDKIENGYIVSHSGYKGNGENKKYFSKKHFSAVNPIKLSKPSISFSGKKK